MPTELEETKPPADAESAADAPADAAAAPAAPDVSSAVAAAVAPSVDEPADEGSRKRAREEGSSLGAPHYDHGAAAAAAAPTTFAWEAKLAELIASGKIVKDHRHHHRLSPLTSHLSPLTPRPSRLHQARL